MWGIIIPFVILVVSFVTTVYLFRYFSRKK